MENTINIGELDTLVEIQSCTITRGDRGQAAYQFAKFRRVFAKVDRDVTETIADGNLEEGQYVRLTIYKIPELTTRWRVIIDGVPYSVSAIDPVRRISPLCVLTLKSIES